MAATAVDWPVTARRTHNRSPFGRGAIVADDTPADQTGRRCARDDCPMGLRSGCSPLRPRTYLWATPHISRSEANAYYATMTNDRQKLDHVLTVSACSLTTAHSVLIHLRPTL